MIKNDIVTMIRTNFIYYVPTTKKVAVTYMPEAKNTVIEELDKLSKDMDFANTIIYDTPDSIFDACYEIYEKIYNILDNRIKGTVSMVSSGILCLAKHQTNYIHWLAYEFRYLFEEEDAIKFKEIKKKFVNRHMLVNYIANALFCRINDNEYTDRMKTILSNFRVYAMGLKTVYAGTEYIQYNIITKCLYEYVDDILPNKLMNRRKREKLISIIQSIEEYVEFNIEKFVDLNGSPRRLNYD